MVRLMVALVILSAMVSCQTTDTHPVFSPAPSPTPHTLPTAAILQSSDIPAGISACPGSGPIDAYLATISDLALSSREATQWQQLRSEGAIQGAISVFTADPSACNVELGATTNAKAMTSFVAEFPDEGEADRAWQAGVLGFVPPPTSQVVDGLSRGASTGLGVSSFVYDRPSVRLASWRRSVFVALVVVSGMDMNTFHAATGAVDARLN